MFDELASGDIAMGIVLGLSCLFVSFCMYASKHLRDISNLVGTMWLLLVCFINGGAVAIAAFVVTVVVTAVAVVAAVVSLMVRC